MMGGMPGLQPFLTAPMMPEMGAMGGPMMMNEPPPQFVDKRGMVEVEYADAVPGDAPIAG